MRNTLLILRALVLVEETGHHHHLCRIHRIPQCQSMLDHELPVVLQESRRCLGPVFTLAALSKMPMWN